MITGIRQQLGTDGLLPAEAWPSGAGDQDTLRGSCVLLQIRPMKVVLLLLYRFSICLCACDCMLLFFVCYDRPLGNLGIRWLDVARRRGVASGLDL